MQSPAQRITEIIRYLKDHDEETRFLLNHFSADDSIIQDMMNERFSDINLFYGDFTKQLDRDTMHLLETFLVHGIYSLIRCWILEDIHKTPEEIGELAQKIAYRGWINLNV
jgi:hypothetical protein